MRHYEWWWRATTWRAGRGGPSVPRPGPAQWSCLVEINGHHGPKERSSSNPRPGTALTAAAGTEGPLWCAPKRVSFQIHPLPPPAPPLALVWSATPAFLSVARQTFTSKWDHAHPPHHLYGVPRVQHQPHTHLCTPQGCYDLSPAAFTAHPITKPNFTSNLTTRKGAGTLPHGVYSAGGGRRWAISQTNRKITAFVKRQHVL